MSLTPHALSIQNHHCCLYARKEEQLQIVKPFIKDSFIRHEKLLYIYAPRCNLSDIEYLQQLDANFVQFHQKGHLELISVPEIFLEKDQFKTDRMIKADVGQEDIQVLAIGPGGENMVKPSSIVVSGSRVVGRCGLGAVMGSKNLKAIAVKGTGSIKINDPDRFIEAVDSISQRGTSCECRGAAHCRRRPHSALRVR